MIKKLRISLCFGPESDILVGEMLRTDRGRIYFQFDPIFLQGTRSISPIKLKPIAQPQRPPDKELNLFDGIFGVFADSLPDSWGLMMMSRTMKRAGLDFSSSSPLDRLSFVGRRGMGALVYDPAVQNPAESNKSLELSALATEVDRVLMGEAIDVLTELAVMGGSPGGARPKVLVGVQRREKGEGNKIISGVEELPDGFDHWIIKFRGKDEGPHAGIVEYIYSATAQHVGLAVPEVRLFGDAMGDTWFGVKRFDRGAANTRIHMHTVAGLVHADFRLPSIDYEDFLKITSAVTRQEQDVLGALRLAAFNIIFHNRDDHAKNFAFTMSKDGLWRLAPAYDLTFAAGPGGEHTTAIMGEGRSPTISHLQRLAANLGIKRAHADKILHEVEDGRAFMLDLFRQHEIKKHPVIKYLSSRN